MLHFNIYYIILKFSCFLIYNFYFISFIMWYIVFVLGDLVTYMSKLFALNFSWRPYWSFRKKLGYVTQRNRRLESTLETAYMYKAAKEFYVAFKNGIAIIKTPATRVSNTRRIIKCNCYTRGERGQCVYMHCTRNKNFYGM